MSFDYIFENNLRNHILDGKIFEDDKFMSFFLSLDRDKKEIFFESLRECADEKLIAGGFRSYDIRINS
ncbi:MAG: hypothetical protein ACD_79C00969G0001, partial [uncultured bacterium]